MKLLFLYCIPQDFESSGVFSKICKIQDVVSNVLENYFLITPI